MSLYRQGESELLAPRTSKFHKTLFSSSRLCLAFGLFLDHYFPFLPTTTLYVLTTPYSQSPSKFVKPFWTLCSLKIKAPSKKLSWTTKVRSLTASKPFYHAKQKIKNLTRPRTFHLINTNGDDLQPDGHGLHPKSDGLHPKYHNRVKTSKPCSEQRKRHPIDKLDEFQVQTSDTGLAALTKAECRNSLRGPKGFARGSR